MLYGQDTGILLYGQDTGILLYGQDTGILLYGQDTGILLYGQDTGILVYCYTVYGQLKSLLLFLKRNKGLKNGCNRWGMHVCCSLVVVVL